MAVWAACATAAGAAATAQADPNSLFYQFQSPSGNISCVMDDVTGTPTAECEIVDHAYPVLPQQCLQGVGGRFELDQGGAAALVCHSDTVRAPGLAALDYGPTRSVGSLTCDSESSGVTCTDAGTGHFFRVARESYLLH